MVHAVPVLEIHIFIVAIPDGETFETLLTMEIARCLWGDQMFPIGGKGD